MRPLLLEAPSSHLYPGIVLRIAGKARSLPAKTVSCLLVFADGSTASVIVQRAGGACRLDVEGYTTAQGTVIVAKSWDVVPMPSRALKVCRRVRT